MKVNLILPNQLFPEFLLLEDIKTYLMEESLFFNQYNFHKIKIAYHRATMQFYKDYLTSLKIDVDYVNAQQEDSDVRHWIKNLPEEVTEIHLYKPEDNWLLKRIQHAADGRNIKLVFKENPLFINSSADNLKFFRKDKQKFFQTSFYKNQRKRLGILLEAGEPTGGRWSFDADNRKKYPAKKTPPAYVFQDDNGYWQEAKKYVAEHYSKNIGALLEDSPYPVTYKDAETHFQNFLKDRFYAFGDYEDAIVKEVNFLHHSVITPYLNIGFISPLEIIKKALLYAEKDNIAINNVEGFVRQLIGWREFIRGIYHVKGSYQRTSNFWGHTRDIPKNFYDGTTGIDPIDSTIKKVLKTGYCHHIERLMVLGNFMLLCEFEPNQVYKWFMELFIDAYDWVMVPNVYGMALFSDGGLFATKPYISSSNYILKMSNYKKGEWQQVWDGLFWNFMDKNSSFFSSNPRLGLLLNTWNKMDQEKREQHLLTADKFLNSL